MAIQARQNLDTTPFVIYGYPASREDDAVILQDAGRATVLEQFTLMGKVAATEKWVPFTDETALTGEAVNLGIYVGDEITAAAIVAGDVVDTPILIHGAKFDEGKLIIENSKTLETVVNATGGADNIAVRTVRDILREQSLIPVSTQTASSPENV